MKNIRVNLENTDIVREDFCQYIKKTEEALEYLKSGNDAFAGWVKLPLYIEESEFAKLEATAEKIKAESELLVVVGIGGSYLGAKAVIEAMGCDAKNNSPIANRRYDKAVQVVFAGNNMSAHYHRQILDMVGQCETSLCVISKSGTTAEASVAFALIKEALVAKYGQEEASQRIYAITDKEKGILRQEVNEKGYTSFVVPDDIGGRYSVLTPVGLLPIMVAGIDARALINGAKNMAERFTNYDATTENLLSYAIARRILEKNFGKTIEIFEYYEPRLQYFAEWLKQLFGESEGKDGQGIFPSSLCFSTDLHSMGQFLQEGRQTFFETLISVKDEPMDIVVPKSAGGIVAGKSLKAINDAAQNGVITAHRTAGIQVIKIELPCLDEYCLGEMIYFFEMTCAVTCLLAGVNPFNQPGVEAYKAEMKKELAK